jgi:hypothetical protein
MKVLTDIIIHFYDRLNLSIQKNLTFKCEMLKFMECLNE